MDRTILLSAVGFREFMVQGIIDYLEPDEVVLIYGSHGKCQDAYGKLVRRAKTDRRPLQSHLVDDWDMLEWSDAIEAAMDRHKDDRVIVNVTAGHTLAVSMFAVHAAKRGLPVVVYDWEEEAETGKRPDDWMETKIHQHSPGAVLNLRKVSDVDQKVLDAVLDGPGAVAEICTRTSLAQSSVSTSLARLAKKGYVAHERRNAGREYRLHEGIAPMIHKALRGPPVDS